MYRKKYCSALKKRAFEVHIHYSNSSDDCNEPFYLAIRDKLKVAISHHWWISIWKISRKLHLRWKIDPWWCTHQVRDLLLPNIVMTVIICAQTYWMRVVANGRPYDETTSVIVNAFAYLHNTPSLLIFFFSFSVILYYNNLSLFSTFLFFVIYNDCKFITYTRVITYFARAINYKSRINKHRL